MLFANLAEKTLRAVTMNAGRVISVLAMRVRNGTKIEEVLT
jgi:hypothetical protein